VHHRILRHIRSQAVGYLALFIALGGVSYAATQLPAGSVGAAQIRNHVLTPVKNDNRYINGTVRAWASVSAAGKIIAGGAGLSVLGDQGATGHYGVFPSRRSRIARPSGCAPVASVDAPQIGSTPTPGFVVTQLSLIRRQPWELNLAVYNAQGQLASLPFVVEIVC
jgi:hypothetical protein